MTVLTDKIEKHRKNTFGSQPIFINRWSPRAMTGETVSDDDLMALFEAAHWAPSAYNNQPWRFVYACRDDAEWNRFFNLLVLPNQRWCENAAALIVIISKTTFDHNGRPMKTHAFDTGSAWGMLALEGAARGLVVHGMQGFDYARAKKDLGVPDGYEVQAMAAVGILAEPSTLEDQMSEREFPSGRKELSQLVARGRFNDDIK